MGDNIFEKIKKINKYGQEFWRARDLYKLLCYTEYGKFLPAIERAKKSCVNSGRKIDLHFAHASEPQKSRNQCGEIKGQIQGANSFDYLTCYVIITVM